AGSRWPASRCSRSARSPWPSPWSRRSWARASTPASCRRSSTRPSRTARSSVISPPPRSRSPPFSNRAGSLPRSIDASAPDAVLEFAGISKDYRGLRPLRIAELRVAAGEHIAILGFDRPAAEVFVNLATGAILPDAGEVAILGRSTSAISDSADWLSTVDRFGIVSDRAVLLDQLTVVQNLAMPFTLAIEPPSSEVRERAVALAREVGLPEMSWDAPVSALDAAGLVRVRLGRAIALDPAVLLLEHISASVGRDA